MPDLAQWMGTYRGWEHSKEPFVYFASVLWLILLLVVSNKCHPRVSVSLRIIFDTVLQLADLVVREAVR